MQPAQAHYCAGPLQATAPDCTAEQGLHPHSSTPEPCMSPATCTGRSCDRLMRPPLWILLLVPCKASGKQQRTSDAQPGTLQLINLKRHRQSSTSWASCAIPRCRWDFSKLSSRPPTTPSQLSLTFSNVQAWYACRSIGSMCRRLLHSSITHTASDCMRPQGGMHLAPLLLQAVCALRPRQLTLSCSISKA